MIKSEHREEVPHRHSAAQAAHPTGAQVRVQSPITGVPAAAEKEETREAPWEAAGYRQNGPPGRVFPGRLKRGCRGCCLVTGSNSVTPRAAARQLLRPWDSPGKNTGVGCHFLLQGVFLTRGSNPCLLHWQVFFFFFF